MEPKEESVRPKELGISYELMHMPPKARCVSKIIASDNVQLQRWLKDEAVSVYWMKKRLWVRQKGEREWVFK